MPLSNLRRRKLLVALGSAGLASAAGCTSDDDGTGQDTDTVPTTDGYPIQPEWRTTTPRGATTLHLYHLDDSNSIFRVGTLLDGAYVLDENDEFYGEWVADVENVGNEEYVYTLRDDLQWGGDYGRMTADDWVFHYDAVVRPAVEGDNWTDYVDPDPWTGVAAVEAEDDLTFTVTLDAPDPVWTRREAMWKELIYPADLVRPYYEDYRDGDSSAGENLAKADAVENFTYTGNLGPYELETHDRFYQWVVTRNDDYYRRGTGPDAEDWEHAPYFQRLRIRTRRDRSERLDRLENREISGLGATSAIPPDSIETVAGWDHTRMRSIPTGSLYMTPYNQRANGWPPFRNPAVRRAFSAVVDKEHVARQIYHGGATPAQTFQPEWSAFYDDAGVEPVGVGDSYDPEGARSTLESELGSGYGYDGGSLVGPDGSTVALTLVYMDLTTQREETAAYIADRYEQALGVDVELVDVGQEEFVESYVRQRTDAGDLVTNAGDPDEYTSERDWDVMALSLGTTPRTPAKLTRVWAADGVANFVGWRPPGDVDLRESLAAARSDLESLKAALAEIYGLLSREQPANFVFFRDIVTAYDETVQFTEPASRSFGYKGWTWYKDANPFA